MADKTTLPFGEACRRGFGLAWSSPGIVALGLLAEASAVLLSVGLQIALALLLFRELIHKLTIAVTPLFSLSTTAQLPRLPNIADWLIPLVAAALTSAIIALTLRALWMGAGIRQFAERLLDPSAATPVLASGSANLLRVILVGLLFLPIACVGWLIGATLIGAGALLFFQAIGPEVPNLSIAMLVALALTIAIFASKGIDLLFRATLVRAVAAASGPIDALTGGCRLLWDRLGSFIAIFLIFGFLQWMALSATSALGASVRALPSSTGTPALLLVGLALASAIAGALVLSYLTAAEYAAYTAIDLDARGHLPGSRPAPGGGQAGQAGEAHGTVPLALRQPPGDTSGIERPTAPRQAAAHPGDAEPCPTVLLTAGLPRARALSRDAAEAEAGMAVRPLEQGAAGAEVPIVETRLVRGEDTEKGGPREGCAGQAQGQGDLAEGGPASSAGAEIDLALPAVVAVELSDEISIEVDLSDGEEAEEAIELASAEFEAIDDP